MNHLKLVNDYIPKYTEMLTTEGNVDPSVMVILYFFEFILFFFNEKSANL